MKKLLIASFALFVAVVGIRTTSAMTETELRAKINQTITLKDGSKYKLSADKMVLVDRYLKENEVSEKDADYIASKLEEAIAIAKKYTISELKKLPTSTKDDLKALVSDVAANTSVKATVKGESLIVYNDDDTKFAEVTVDDLVKQTGTETNTIAIIASVAFVITLVGAVFVVRQVKMSK